MPEELSVKGGQWPTRGTGGEVSGREGRKKGWWGRSRRNPVPGSQETARPSAFEVRIPGDGTWHLFSSPFSPSGPQLLFPGQCRQVLTVTLRDFFFPGGPCSRSIPSMRQSQDSWQPRNPILAPGMSVSHPPPVSLATSFSPACSLQDPS